MEMVLAEHGDKRKYQGGIVAIIASYGYKSIMFIPEYLRFWIFIIFSLVLLGAGAWLLRTHNLGMRGTIAIWLIVGGAIGNLVDRVVLGSVSEFLYLGFVSLWGLFTVANLAIACGAVLLIYSSRVRRKKTL